MCPSCPSLNIAFRCWFYLGAFSQTFSSPFFKKISFHPHNTTTTFHLLHSACQGTHLPPSRATSLVYTLSCLPRECIAILMQSLSCMLFQIRQSCAWLPCHNLRKCKTKTTFKNGLSFPNWRIYWCIYVVV